MPAWQRVGVTLLALALLLSRAAPAQATYIERNTIVTCGAGNDGSLQLAGAAAVSVTYSFPRNGSTTAQLATGVGHPNSTSWNGTYTAQVNVTAVSIGANDTIDVSLIRLNSSCVLQETIAADVASQSQPLAVQVFTFNFTSVGWAGPVACADLFGIQITFSDVVGLATNTATVEYNVSPNDTVATPITEGAGCAAAATPPLRSLMGVGR